MERFSSAGWRLSLILPAYNEAQGIRQAIEEADAALARFTTDYEILVVDDGSRDDTAAIVTREIGSRPHVRLLRHPMNRGYGTALRTGFTAARFERVAFTDADCQFHLEDLAGLLKLTEQHPVAVGYRIDRKDPARRRFLSWGYNTLIRTLLGTRVRDCDCALKVFHKDALASLLPQTSGFFVNTEMLTRARQRGYSVAETGVRHRPRLRGTSTVSLRDVPRTLSALLPFWWSRVLFAGTCRKPRHSVEQTAGLDWGFLLVVAAAALLFFTKLTCPLQEPQEARYAEIPRQMLAEGSWLVPILNGQPYCDKPPLLYWLLMGAYQVFGVHDWAARLVPSLAGFLTVLVTYYWGLRTLGKRPALAGAAILCLSARFVYYGRMVTMDPVVTLWVTAALAAAHLAIQETLLRSVAKRWWVISALACGLGILTKGPIALVLTVVPILAMQLLDPRVARPQWRAWSAYMAVAMGLAMPWFTAVAIRKGDFAVDFFWRHNVLRFVAPFDHEGPPWYYLPGLVLGLLPWSLLLPGFVRYLARRSTRSAKRRPAALGYLLVASVWCLLFFSMAGCKRPAYILPALPPLALALGCYLAVIVPERRWRATFGNIAGRFAALPVRATALVLLLGAGFALTAVGMQMMKPAAGLALLGSASLGGALLAWRARRIRPVQAWWLCGTVTFGVLFAGVHQLLPANARRFSLRGPIHSMALAKSQATMPVACFPHAWDSVGFYLPGHTVRVYGADERSRLVKDVQCRPATIIVAKSGSDLDTLLEDLPPWMEFIPQKRKGIWVVGRVFPRAEVPDGLFAER